jgi:hypothetical protein
MGHDDGGEVGEEAGNQTGRQSKNIPSGENVVVDES